MILFSCGGSLSDKQRREIREKMDMNKIVHITEAEITGAAFAKGRSIVEKLDSLKADSAVLDSFLTANRDRIHYVRPGEPNVRGLEQQLLEAYMADPTGVMEDNVQEKRDGNGDYDSLLYTEPVTKQTPDGNEALQGIWNIWLSKKELVLQIGKNK